MKILLFAWLFFTITSMSFYMIYWLILRQYLLYVTQAKLMHVFVEVRTLGLRYPQNHPGYIEAARGQIACVAMKDQMSQLNIGDVLTGNIKFIAPGDVQLGREIGEREAEEFRRLHEKFRSIVSTSILINSPVWFSIVMLLRYNSKWSTHARKWSDKISSLLDDRIGVGFTPT